MICARCKLETPADQLIAVSLDPVPVECCKFCYEAVFDLPVPEPCPEPAPPINKWKLTTHGDEQRSWGLDIRKSLTGDVVADGSYELVSTEYASDKVMVVEMPYELVSADGTRWLHDIPINGEDAAAPFQHDLNRLPVEIEGRGVEAGVCSGCNRMFAKAGLCCFSSFQLCDDCQNGRTIYTTELTAEQLSGDTARVPAEARWEKVPARKKRTVQSTKFDVHIVQRLDCQQLAKMNEEGELFACEVCPFLGHEDACNKKMVDGVLDFFCPSCGGNAHNEFWMADVHGLEFSVCEHCSHYFFICDVADQVEGGGFICPSCGKETA